VTPEDAARTWRTVCPPGTTALLVAPDGRELDRIAGDAPWPTVGERGARYPRAWVALYAEPARRAAFRWTAIDWDNKDGDSARAHAIRALEGAVAKLARSEGLGYLYWPSKTAGLYPQSGAGHSFFLVGVAPRQARPLIAALLNAASRQVGVPLEAAGLGSGGAWWFPPDVPVPARLTLFRVDTAENFLACWADQAKVAPETFRTEPDELQ
jgi:hypothetical protein